MEKFDEYSKWRDDFYLPVSKNTFNSLSSKGHMFINIMESTIKGKRYYSSDELVDSLKDNFVGQIGMRIMRKDLNQINCLVVKKKKQSL